MPVVIRNFFGNLSLSRRFMVASLVILLGGMAGVGAWVAKQIETGVIHRTGATTALYVDSFVAPNLQELGQSEQVMPEHIAELSKLLLNTAMGQQIVAFKVWDTKGKLLYSTDSSIMGKTYPMHEGLLRARIGFVNSEISFLDQEENAPLAEKYDKLLETYSPVWLSGTNKIIAVAEFYQLTDELDQEIGSLKTKSWFVVGLIILIMYLLLSIFVDRASDTISRQQNELGVKVAQLTQLLSQNRELHERVRRAAASVALLNESYLRRVGSELHDGPAQDLGISILKLDTVIEWGENHPREPLDQAMLVQLGDVETSMQSALKEIRSMAVGLSLPQLKELGLPATILLVVRNHERHSGTQVALDLGTIPQVIALPIKTTIYRLIQEALNNAFRHANGAGQQVHVGTEGDHLIVEISDRGPGFLTGIADKREGHLGLSGMRERVESLGGQFMIETELGQGTRIIARLPCQNDGDNQR